MMEQQHAPKGMENCQWLWKLLQKLDSEYLTFLGGFTSSIVISEFFELFLIRFPDEGWHQLPFMLGNALLLGGATLLLMSFTHRFAALQRDLLSLQDEQSRAAKVERRWDELKHPVHRMRCAMRGVVVLCGCSLLLGIARFVVTNFVI